MKNPSLPARRPQRPWAGLRSALGALVVLSLAACGGGGGGGTASAPANPSVALQVKDLQPSDPADTVGAFVALQASTPARGADTGASAEQMRVQAQEQFLQELAAAVRRPASGAATSDTCDAAALATRLAQAYKPTSGTAVRIELNACELNLLPGLSSVKGVYADIPLAPNATASSSTVAAFNQAVIDGFDGSKAWPTYSGGTVSATGANTVIAVLDTGVEDRHPAFKGTGKVLPGACFSTPSTGGVGFCPQWANGGSVADTTSSDAGRSCVDKLGSTNRAQALSGGCGHGTSMAATAAMAYAEGTVSAGGVAKAAAILPVQVFSGSNANNTVSISANSGDLLRGIEWVTQQAKARNEQKLTPIVALNMSLGGGSYTAACDNEYVGSLFYTAFSNLRAQGVIPVIAAGNSYTTDAVSFPACVSNTVSVAAAKLGGKTPASYTNFSAQVKLFAIGGDVDAKYNMPTPCANAAETECWSGGAGTSPATAMVSGAVAVLRSAKPSASLSEVEAALVTSDKSIPMPNTGLTRPLLRVSTAVAQLLGGTNPDTPPTPTPTPTPAPTPAPVPDPAPVQADYTRLCIYSLPNYQGQRACGIFSKGDAYLFAGYWRVASVRFFKFDFSNPLATDKLVATPHPVVSFYDTLTRQARLSGTGVQVSDDMPDLSTTLPSRGQVRMLKFIWTTP